MACVSLRYESPEIALNCGIMLRECVRHEPLAKITLWSEQFYDFFRYVEMSTFDIASDAFATFKVSWVPIVPGLSDDGHSFLLLKNGQKISTTGHMVTCRLVIRCVIDLRRPRQAHCMEMACMKQTAD